MNAKVTIDASALQDGPGYYSGIARTTRELVFELLRTQLPFELSLFSQRLRGRGLQNHAFDVPTRHLRLPRSKIIGKITAATGLIEAMCGCDLFHAPSNYAAVKRLDRTIVTIHDAMFYAYPESHLGASLEQDRIPPMARGCRKILTPSEASKRDIIRFLQVDPEKIVVTPWGVRHDIFKPALDLGLLRRVLVNRFGLERPYFLSVSCDIGRKNSVRVLSQYVKLLKQSPKHDLVMVWRRPPLEIQQLAISGSGRQRINLIASVSDEELRDLYCGATATFFPSFYEGFGLPILESMACGTPVVTSNNSSLCEVGGNAVLYVDPADDTDVYKAFEFFEQSPHISKEMSAKGLQRAKTFTWEKCARQTIEIYRSCLNELS